MITKLRKLFVITCYQIAYFFEDLGERFDFEFHDELAESLKNPPTHRIEFVPIDQDNPTS